MIFIFFVFLERGLSYAVVNRALLIVVLNIEETEELPWMSLKAGNTPHDGNRLDRS